MLRGVYTWSKTIDDGDSVNATTSGSEPALVSNPFDLRADRGLANFDVRHAAVISASYALPFGPGKQFMSTASGAEKAVVGGWILNSVVTLQGGFPITPQLSYNPSNNGDTKNPVRPFVNPNFTGPVVTGNPNQWFNPAAFLSYPTGSGFYGNLGRDTVPGPGLGTWDLSAMKAFPLRERLNLQFRAEFFNILNRANFSFPNPLAFTPTGVSPTAGLITSTATTSRQIQLEPEADLVTVPRGFKMALSAGYFPFWFRSGEQLRRTAVIRISYERVSEEQLPRVSATTPSLPCRLWRRIGLPTRS